MTAQSPVGDESVSPIKRALREILDLRAQLENEKRREPIAIVGMGFRLPGGIRNAAAFEQLLWNGTDAITGIPASRWSLDDLYATDPDAPGKMVTRFGSFVDDVDKFDAEFFGISPREAASMDPQQRLTLEVAWEALENAGHAGADLAGSRVGVFYGVANNDYGRALYQHPELIDAYFSTGNAYSVVTGRLSYFLGVNGPSIAVDTACSSSLVALHLACQSLQERECDAALAGGVNLILTPEMNINFSKARMMAPDGRCKTFDAAADGYVRGEGCGVLMLKRLADATADGDNVLAIVRGSALNQDGRSGGLTAPNGPSQEAVIRAALSRAEVSGRDVGYVEAHGTGTPLGDPIEVGAIGAALCDERDPQRPLLIGSVKTNLGHLEAAAGVVGVIKVLLAMRRREIPPHLHFTSGNPLIPWNELSLAVPTTTTPWTPINGRRIAGVSSFGFSGTNAHVVLEEAPRRDAPTDAPTTRAADAEESLFHVLPLAARDSVALIDLARRFAEMPVDDATVDGVCYTVAVGRTHFPKRVAVTGSSLNEMQRHLRDFVAGAENSAVATGDPAQNERPRVAFLFTGQGAQHHGMTRSLYASSGVFRETLDTCAVVLREHMDRDLLDLLFNDGDTESINETRYAQPVNLAIEIALARLWKSWGITPEAVMGHSLGEYAAACIAGVLPLNDALRVVAERGRLTHSHALPGAMGAVFTDESSVRAAVAAANGALSIAAFNGPEHFVISGTREAVAQALAAFEAGGVRVKALRVPHGAHSAQIDAVMAPFRHVLNTVRFGVAEIPLISNVSGALATSEELATPSYWLTHMRQPVQFSAAVRALAARGITHFIEIGPHPVLLGMGAECVNDTRYRWLPSLQRTRDDRATMLETLQRLYVDGADVDWNAFHAERKGHRLALPTYPFRTRTHWMDIVGQRRAPHIDGGTRWKQVQDAVGQQAAQGPLDLNAASYPAKWACLEGITNAHAISVLTGSALFTRVNDTHTLADVLERASIAVSYRHLVKRWLDRLVHSGLLDDSDGAYVARTPLVPPDFSALWTEAEQLFVDNKPLLAYVRHCGSLVDAVLRGETSPLETLFPGGSSELATDLYERSATMRYVNGVAAAAMRTIGAAVPAGRTLRILEVGAGTGGTTASILPALPSDRVRYVFSDVSDVFLDQARERFAQFSFVDYRRFDMELPPAAQGFEPGAFDVIVSANAVHASTDLRKTLVALRTLLAPGGLLVLVESTTHFAWFDMTTGLIEGWQHFADDLRTDNPLLAPETWLRALDDAGFLDVRAWPDAASPASVLGQHVVIATTAGDAVAEMAGRVPDEALSARANSGETLAVSGIAMADVRQQVLDSLPGDRLDVLREFVRDRVMHILRLDVSQAPARTDRLMDAGFDSLMAVQLRNQLGRGLSLERPLPSTLMFDYPTIDAIATELLTRLVPEIPVVAGVPEPAARPRITEAEVADMSDDEVEALMLARLNQL